MRHRKGILPGRAPGVLTAPGDRVKILRHVATLVFPSHKAAVFVKEIFVIFAPRHILADDIISSEYLCHSGNAKVSIGGIKSQIHRFLMLISRHVAVFQVRCRTVSAVAGVGRLIDCVV